MHAVYARKSRVVFALVFPPRWIPLFLVLDPRSLVHRMLTTFTLHEQRQRRPTHHYKIPSTIRIRRTSLQPRPSTRLRRIACRRLRGVHKRVTRDGAGLAVGARGGDQFDRADLSATGRVRGHKRAAPCVRLGADFTGCWCKLRGGGDDGAAALGVSGGADDGGTVLGRGHGLALGVCADDGHGDRGGDLAEHGGGLDNGLAARVGCSLWNIDDDGTVGVGRRGGRVVAGRSVAALLGRGRVAALRRCVRGLRVRRRCHRCAVGGCLALLQVLDGGDDKLGCEGRVLVVHLLDAAVVRLEDARLEVLEPAECCLERLLGQCVEQVPECFLRAGVDGLGLVDLLSRRRGLLGKHRSEEREGQKGHSAERAHRGVAVSSEAPIGKRP